MSTRNLTSSQGTLLNDQLETPKEKNRFVVLDIFRGLFAFFVFLFHLRPFANTPVINNSFVDNCDLFVDFFFVLSGFVIALNYLHMKDAPELWSFLKRRFRRIYPLHIILLFIFLAIELSKTFLSAYVHINDVNHDYNTPGSFVSSVLLLNSTGMFVQGVCWNIASWSISAEMIAYLLFTASIYATVKAGTRVNFLYTTIVLIVASVFALNLLTEGFQFDYTFDYGYLRGIIGFFTGILCFYLYQRINLSLRRIKDGYFSVMECLTLGLLVYIIYKGAVYKVFGLTLELLFLTCILVFSMEKGILSKYLKKISILNNLGKYSYSIYLTHTLMISLFNVVFIRIIKFDPSDYNYLFFVNFVLIYLFSSWTYKNIEMKGYHHKYR